MSHPDALQRALADAQRFLGELQPPPNEANTCDWVIRPLLLALGYENHEISSQAGDTANKFPDYTILPQTNLAWYLEAKAWSVGLESIHVDQAINYAHSNGQRWVVLSNGREWRLYDDEIRGKSADRLVDTARLEDTDGILRFLSALSRESIRDKKVEIFANERRVRDYLTRAIADPNSSVVQAIQKVIRAELGNSPVTREAIVDILNAAQSGVSIQSTVDNAPVVQAPMASAALERKNASITDKGRPSPTLKGLDPGTNQVVPSKQICFPDGSTKAISYWKHILVGVAQWLAESGRLTSAHVPVDLGRGSTRYLVNSEPVHKSGARFTEPFQAGPFYVESHYSARDCVRLAQVLLDRFGVPHDHVRFG